MKKSLSLVLAIVFALCLFVPAMAAGSYTVTLINGMDGSVYDTYEVADGEDFVFTISCSAPCDMGPIAAGDAGSGVTTTDGVIAYSNITLGGPNQYPTAETVTISGIASDATVTVTPNPDEVDSVFPAITEGAAAGGASGEASGDASGDASGEPSGEPSDEPYPLFDEYKEYLYETMMQDSFWQGNEANLRAGLDAAESPEDESIQNFTGSGDVDQAPAGVVFPMTYDVWYAANASAAGGYSADEAGYKAYLKDWVAANPAVQANIDDFNAGIDAGAYGDFPMEMCFTDQWFGFAALTLDEFLAAGGVAEIPAFDPNLAPDAEP